MSNKLYITDLDGTLLNDAPALSEFSRRGIERILDAGIDFTVASARNLASQKQLLGDLALPIPVIEINGAYISDYSSGTHRIINEIDPEVCKGIIQASNAHGCKPFVTAHDAGIDRLYYEEVCNEGSRWFLGDKTEGHSKHAKEIETIEHILEEKIVCFTIIGDQKLIEILYNSIEEKFGEKLDCFYFENPYSPGWFWLTIHDTLAQKNNAVLELTNFTGHIATDLVVFGDQLNDVGMMKLNQHGATSVAVENAIDEVKACASEIIGNNNADSVVKYILEKEGL